MLCQALPRLTFNLQGTTIMDVFNGISKSSAQNNYGFDAGHVYAVLYGTDWVLYKHIKHDKHILTASPLANPDLLQHFNQSEFDELVKEKRVDPRIEDNKESRQRVLARSPDVKSMRDLTTDEQEQLTNYWLLCRHIVQMRDDGKTSLTDRALKMSIRKVMAMLVFGVDADADVASSGSKRTRGKPQDGSGERKIEARKAKTFQSMPSPSTVRNWIRALEQNEWDILALRDHRKGRVGFRAPKITDPHSVALMAKWVQVYLDRTRPSAAMVYKLMVGSVALEEENARRDKQGNPPLPETDAPSFAAVNVDRTARGLPALPVPSKSTFERAIRKLDSFDVDAARRGSGYARRRHKVSGRVGRALYPGERVPVDFWRVQLKTVKLPTEFWENMPKELVDKVGQIRLSLGIAIDEATKVVLGARLTWNPNADTAMRVLEMVCSDKTEIAMAAGCRSGWGYACSPGIVPTDSGSEFIDAGFRCGVRDIGSANEIGPASHPDARGVIERFFRTLDQQMMQFFQGRTFSGIDEKGEYKPELVANLVTEQLAQLLVRYIVDVYHNSPHGGLGGQTPNEAWKERSALYKVLPPPPSHVIRTVFGFSDNRRIQNRGLRFLGLYYRSSELSKLRKAVGQADVRFRADLEDLSTIWVSNSKPGAKWIAVPCEIDLKVASAALWLEAAAALRRKHAKVSKLEEHIVHAALRDLRDAGRHSAAARGIAPSTMSNKEVLHLETKLFEHFDYTVADERGRSFDGLEGHAANAAEDNCSGIAADSAPGAGDGEDGDEPQPPVSRRSGGMTTNFLRKD